MNISNSLKNRIMETQGVSTITKEQLLENGWKLLRDEGPFVMEKDLADRSELEEGEEPEGEVKLVLHTLYNQPIFALAITDGYLVNINPASIEELNAFEKQILGVDTPY